MTTKTAKPKAAPKNPPLFRFRVGLTQASIWGQTTDQGKVRHSASFKRSFKGRDGWKDTNSYDLQSLLVHRRLVDLAIEKLSELENAPEPEQPADDAHDDDGPYIDDEADVGDSYEE